MDKNPFEDMQKLMNLPFETSKKYFELMEKGQKAMESMAQAQQDMAEFQKAWDELQQMNPLLNQFKQGK